LHFEQFVVEESGKFRFSTNKKEKEAEKSM